MEKVRLGVIGCGVMGRIHAMHAMEHPCGRVTAVADFDKEPAEKLAADLSIPAVYDNAEALLADDQVDAIVIALPTSPRKDITLKAFARGKHVLTEKPVAMNATDVREMIKARGSLIAGCCSARYHFLASTQAAAACIATGRLGRIRAINFRCMMPLAIPTGTPPHAWRLTTAMNGGGIAMNWGCYELDYLLGITGWTLEPKVVLAQCWNVPEQFASYIAPGSDAETHFVALIRCGDGTAITIERAEYVATQPSNTWKIVGETGSLHLHMLAELNKKIVLDYPDAEKGIVSETIWSGDETQDTLHRGTIHDFIDAVRENRPCQTSLEKALIIQRITDAIYESSATGQAVDIPELRRAIR